MRKVKRLYTDIFEVQTDYAIGLARPVGINVKTFGAGIISSDKLVEYGKASCDLTPVGVIEKLHLLDVDCNETRAPMDISARPGFHGNSKKKSRSFR